jgi:HSP20 family protein
LFCYIYQISDDFVCAEILGIPRDKIDVTVTKDAIEISAETGAEKEKNFIVRQRSYSSIYKNLAFPEEVIPEKAECTLKDGLLEVSIPKKTPTPEVKKHKVAVKEAK